MSDEPRPAPFNADELTKADSDAISAFLKARVQDLLDRHPAGSAEARAARALQESAGTLVDQLNLLFHDEDPETLKARMDAWNAVVFTVWLGWKGTEGYDVKRWRRVQHTDIEDAVEGARRLLKSREQLAEKKRAERAHP
ncbi:hypothetical protein ACFCZ1_26670 [Streptomyces sp. NPDC056224]|uniref:hypothetical protein n=1 Tax=Streptomyces sp. NPDC056224 TaxID=3345750 RepID=UPI0035D942A6